jgi:hypothetical protein
MLWRQSRQLKIQIKLGLEFGFEDPTRQTSPSVSAFELMSKMCRAGTGTSSLFWSEMEGMCFTNLGDRLILQIHPTHDHGIQNAYSMYPKIRL